MAFHVMLIPSMNCTSNCSYCWGVDRDSKTMEVEIIEETIRWLKDFKKEPVTFTFHGGEPLLAGFEYFQKALELLSTELKELRPAFAIQTNLWLMDDELARLFAEYIFQWDPALMVPGILTIFREVKAILIRLSVVIGFPGNMGCVSVSSAPSPHIQSNTRRIYSIFSLKTGLI